MNTGGGCRKGVAALLQHGHHFGRETGEGGQCAQKTSDQGQSPDGVEVGQLMEHAHTHTHQITADQVGGQSAPGHEPCSAVAGVEPQAQLPS